MAVAVWGVVGMPCFGIPATAARLDDLSQAVASNDIEQARVIYRGLDLRSGDALETIRTAARAVPASPDALELRREMATKYRLLADDAAPLPAELADVVPYDVPVVEVTTLDVETLDVQAIAISGLTYTVLDVLTLQPDVLRALGIEVPVVQAEIVRIDNARFCELMRLWEARYARQIDYRDAAGNRLVPMPGTVLWRERRAVIQAVEAGGDYDALWDAYNARLAAAVHRRKNLKRERR